MKNGRAIWLEYHRLPCITINVIYFIWFNLTTSLSHRLWIDIVLVQFTRRILSLCLLSNFITWKKCAYFNRFIPLRYKQCFALSWSLIFWLFYTFTWHWFVRAILPRQNQWHVVILFQNIIINTSRGVRGIPRSSYGFHTGPVFAILAWGNALTFSALIIDHSLWFRRLHLLRTVDKLLQLGIHFGFALTLAWFIPSLILSRIWIWRLLKNILADSLLRTEGTVIQNLWLLDLHGIDYHWLTIWKRLLVQIRNILGRGYTMLR